MTEELEGIEGIGKLPPKVLEELRRKAPVHQREGDITLGMAQKMWGFKSRDPVMARLDAMVEQGLLVKYEAAILTCGSAGILYRPVESVEE